MRTRNQEYAAQVFEQVQKVGEDQRKKYGSLAHGLPVLIRTAGLAQALAFVDARRGAAGEKLLEHIAAVVKVEKKENLLERSRKAELREYMCLTREVLAALAWYKRFAQSVLGVEAGAERGGEGRMNTRRACLANVQKTETTNAGLWLDKFICNQAREDKGSRHNLVQDVSDIRVPEVYSHWFERWRQALQDYGAVFRVAKVLGRMAVGLGEESVLETSVALHHTYGVPYIPGSALKGLAAGFARQYLGDDWQADTQAYEIVFGDADTAGYVIFFDALPLPGSRLLYPDVITVHHEEYYQKGNVPPADWDSPNPVPFLSATGKYLVALAGPGPWVEAAFEILQNALLRLGVGAKTSGGYGRLKFELVFSANTGQEMADRLINQIQALKTSQVAGSIQAFYERWRKLDMGLEQKRRVAEAIISKVKDAGREKQLLSKEWYKELLENLGC